MAPALPFAPREPHDPETTEDNDKPPYHRRRALASVDNLSTHMEEDDMGLQNQPSLVKDSQEMEQILVDLGSSDIGQADLLQAIKTLETGGDALSTGEADTIFPLSGFDLADTGDSESDATEDKIKAMQTRLERRCAFLKRRLRLLQARAIGKRVSEEVVQTFEKCARGARKDGAGRPIGLKALLKRVETTAALQASAASRTVVGPKYYRAGTSKGDSSGSASVGIASGTLNGLEDTVGALRSHLSVVKHELDSDATASSSGAESNDEAVTYNNPQQQHMAIEKRALWTWQRARASIASRWGWLQAQVQELEYKIRQHTELKKQVREAKGAVQFEGEPVAYEGALPGADPPDDDPSTETCARVRPLRRDLFKKRKLLQMHNLHIATKKAAKPSDIRCSCVYTETSCPVCTGRADATEPLPPMSTLSSQQRIALVDPGYHPVLSDIKDASPSIHMAALASRAWFRARISKSYRGAHHSSTPRPHASQPHQHPAPKQKRHPTRLKRGRPPLSRKIKEREEESSPSGKERSRGRPSTESRSWRRQSYDIDNIVIPQSVAANTRPQILTYKEILTPKWRVVDVQETSMNNGVGKSNRNRIRMSEESEEEDISEAAVHARHVRAENRERSRFARKQRTRRSHADATDLTHATDAQPTDDYHHHHHHPTTHHENMVTVSAMDTLSTSFFNSTTSTTREDINTVRPYTPRQFPLQDDTYMDMLSAMPDGFRPSSPDPTLNVEDDEDDTSTLSTISPMQFDGDDPDDAEWDPSTEKVERRRNVFR